MGDDEGKVFEQLDVEGGGAAGDEAEDAGGGDESGEESEEEVKAEFGGATQEVVGKEGLPCTFGDCGERDALKVPERVQRGAGDVVPDALLYEVWGRVESVIDADDRGTPRKCVLLLLLLIEMPITRAVVAGGG